MNSDEAMMLTEESARNYLTLIDKQVYGHYGEMMPSEIATIVLSLREGLEYTQDDTFLTANEVLAEVIEAFDELDDDDYFGSWGWRSRLMREV